MSNQLRAITVQAAQDANMPDDFMEDFNIQESSALNIDQRTFVPWSPNLKRKTYESMALAGLADFDMGPETMGVEPPPGSYVDSMGRTVVQPIKYNVVTLDKPIIGYFEKSIPRKVVNLPPLEVTARKPTEMDMLGFRFDLPTLAVQGVVGYLLYKKYRKNAAIGVVGGFVAGPVFNYLRDRFWGGA